MSIITVKLDLAIFFYIFFFRHLILIWTTDLLRIVLPFMVAWLLLLWTLNYSHQHIWLLDSESDRNITYIMHQKLLKRLDCVMYICRDVNPFNLHNIWALCVSIAAAGVFTKFIYIRFTATVFHKYVSFMHIWLPVCLNWLPQWLFDPIPHKREQNFLMPVQ